eukprot:gnl/TRDRNA2_/TRDRNA2_129746_c1_seq2.p1 gnl/TRDRNA2_/TRDRNA2_129746_c1~~gnl/TRDRNA2_/TRDRNA2_129746_c1_seq2.p1  ORF type:complete len:117 (+),score=25.63 gnl/TRDRNA2_/TRDRNA2_129746_c1_seq2:276-626(+)
MPSKGSSWVEKSSPGQAEGIRNAPYLDTSSMDHEAAQAAAEKAAPEKGTAEQAARVKTAAENVQRDQGRTAGMTQTASLKKPVSLSPVCLDSGGVNADEGPTVMQPYRSEDIALIV